MTSHPFSLSLVYSEQMLKNFKYDLEYFFYFLGRSSEANYYWQFGGFKWVLPAIALEKFSHLESHGKRNLSASIKKWKVKNQWICIIWGEERGAVIII